ncbi:unnamed protein product [Musa banksii]
MRYGGMGEAERGLRPQLRVSFAHRRQRWQLSIRRLPHGTRKPQPFTPNTFLAIEMDFECFVEGQLKLLWESMMFDFDFGVPRREEHWK